MHLVGRGEADLGVPLSRGKHSDLVQELIDAGQQVPSVASLVGHIVEHLTIVHVNIIVLSM